MFDCAQTSFCSGALFYPSSNEPTFRPHLHGHLRDPPPRRARFTKRIGLTTCYPDHRCVYNDSRWSHMPSNDLVARVAWLINRSAEEALDIGNELSNSRCVQYIFSRNVSSQLSSIFIIFVTFHLAFRQWESALLAFKRAGELVPTSSWCWIVGRLVSCCASLPYFSCVCVVICLLLTNRTDAFVQWISHMKTEGVLTWFVHKFFRCCAMEQRR